MKEKLSFSKSKLIKMTLNNFLKQIIFPALLAFGIYTYNCYIGKRGLYLFDFSIVYNMGWLLFKGWIPFVDFKMPLMPLSGILTALSFYFFSVKYYSAVKFAGIICAFSLIYMAINSKNIWEFFWIRCRLDNNLVNHSDSRNLLLQPSQHAAAINLSDFGNRFYDEL
jgi:hypothetical protein